MGDVRSRGWYDTFPGGGRAWVAVDGPYNEHLVRDFGGLNLALAVVTIAALVKFTPTLLRIAGLAGMAFALPHLVYHLRHLDTYTGVDRTMNAVSLSGALVMSILVLALARSAERREFTYVPAPRSRAARAPAPARAP